MAKKKSLQLILIFFGIFFLQFANGQIRPKQNTANSANPNLANPIIPNRQARNLVGSEQNAADLRQSELAQRGLQFLSRTNLREIDRIKWPDNPDLEGPSKVKYQDIDEVISLPEKKKITLQNCKKLSAQYESEVLANYGIRKGTIPEFESICERLAIALKRVKRPDHSSFIVVGQFVLNRLDTALFAYLESSEYERAKVYQKSVFGMLGLPAKYATTALQILVLLSLGLNGFLLYKVLS